MEHEALTPPPSGRLIAPVWTQWPLSPRITKDPSSYSDNSKQDEKGGPVGGSKINELASVSTKPDDPISKGSSCSSENYELICTYPSHRTETSPAAEIIIASSYPTKARKPSRDEASRKLHLVIQYSAVQRVDES